MLGRLVNAALHRGDHSWREPLGDGHDDAPERARAAVGCRGPAVDRGQDLPRPALGVTAPERDPGAVIGRVQDQLRPPARVLIVTRLHLAVGHDPAELGHEARMSPEPVRGTRLGGLERLVDDLVLAEQVRAPRLVLGALGELAGAPERGHALGALPEPEQARAEVPVPFVPVVARGDHAAHLGDPALVAPLGRGLVLRELPELPAHPSAVLPVGQFHVLAHPPVPACGRVAADEPLLVVALVPVDQRPDGDLRVRLEERGHVLGQFHALVRVERERVGRPGFACAVERELARGGVVARPEEHALVHFARRAGLASRSARRLHRARAPAALDEGEAVDASANAPDGVADYSLRARPE